MCNERPLLFTGTEAARFLGLGQYTMFDWYRGKFHIEPSFSYTRAGKSQPLWSREVLELARAAIERDRAGSASVAARARLVERRRELLIDA